MKLYLSPQRSDNELSYLFEGNEVTVTHKTFTDEKTETFDLTDVYQVEDDGLEIIKDSEILPVNPIVSVQEIDGELYVTVLRYHGKNPPHEVAWPDWWNRRWKMCTVNSAKSTKSFIKAPSSRCSFRFW